MLLSLEGEALEQVEKVELSTPKRSKKYRQDRKQAGSGCKPPGAASVKNFLSDSLPSVGSQLKTFCQPRTKS